MLLDLFLTISFLTPISLSLEQPITSKAAQTYDQQPVIVKGFLYADKSGDLILGHRPNLKSCCVGSQELINQQLKVEGSFSPSLTAVDLKGVFSIASEQNEQGEFFPRYILKNAALIERSSHSGYNISKILIISMIFVGIFFGIRSLHRSKNRE